MDVKNCFKINLYLYNETWRMNSLILFQRFSANKKGINGNLSEILRNLNGITNALFPKDPF